MKITFLTNYFNHHQKFISEELNGLVDSYKFVSTSEMREERKTLGYGELLIPSYVCYYKDSENELAQHIVDSDVVIIGTAPNNLIRSRIKNSKCVFRYSERPFKNGNSFIKFLPRLIKHYMRNPLKKPIYLLCASAYTSYDFNKYKLFKNKAYKWGYFPKTEYYDIDALISNKSSNTILWCGRFLDWKHPDDIITVARKLKDEGYIFKIKIIGTGVMENTLKHTVSQHKLDNDVVFLGAMKPYQVREHMEKAGIYLFTSDKREGWGAVLNESMNSACAVVASHSIGSVPYLIGNNENGLIYKSGDVDMLYKKVKYLLDNPNEQKRLGHNAYNTIVETWNAKVAAERFIELTKRILDGEKSPDLYENGPCSKAEIIKDDWFNE